MDDYFLKIEPIHLSCFMNIIKGGALPKNGHIWELTNEIKPLELYCYLYAKFGPPNGMQNLLRTDDSDNLIHWEWAFGHEDGLITIQGHNFRSEVHCIGDFKKRSLTVEQLISQFKGDFKNYGKAITARRLELEKWEEFLNPYHRIRSTVEFQINKIEELELNPAKDKIGNLFQDNDIEGTTKRWDIITEKYTLAIGLTFGLRAMLPVLAESFINLLIFVLSRKEIKENERLFNNTIRQNIDIRVQSLHLNCIGFKNPVDYKSPECKEFHTLMNERNDLLHGNVELSKLSLGNVYFDGTVPIFEKYEDVWEKTIGLSLNSVKFHTLKEDLNKVNKFIEYVLEQIDPKIKKEIEIITQKRQLGFNHKTGRIGILFPDHIVDFRAGPGNNKETAPEEPSPL
ncbi:hypothetical protein ACNKH9_23050 [Metapseudomonas otitidis]|uniref:hypothetical protein n=1 Tax=Metapseudomonas otitidis TaxID=319939 RepID=UPI003A867875